MANSKNPHEVVALRKSLGQFLNTKDEQGRVISGAKFGVYAFFDYDGEPIYVGQTREKLRARIGRHLTNQRTDAVAMNVLDPFEVAEIEVWPLFDLDVKGISDKQIQYRLNATEYTVYQLVLGKSTFQAVLNEKDMVATELVELPPSFRGTIVPDEFYELRKHPDIRIARRAQTIANLSRVISERDVSKGLRRTLVTQAQRLERLASERLQEISGSIPVEGTDENSEGEES